MLNNWTQIGLVIILLIASDLGVLHAQSGIYSIDSTGSEIKFKVSHMGAFKVKGQFKNFKGSIIYSDGIFQEIESYIRVASINTNNEERDAILRTEPYFDIANFPEIVYRADGISLINGVTHLQGSLKIKAVEKDLSFPVEIMYNNESNTLTIIGETRIERRNFQLVFGSMNGFIGNKVHIQLHIVAEIN